MKFVISSRGLMLGGMALVGLLSGSAQASVLVSNLGVTTDAVAETVYDTRWVGASFTTDGSAHTLSTVTLKMGVYTGTATDLFGVSLFTWNAGKPGTKLADLVGPTQPAGPGLFTYTDNLGSALSANTTYWIVAQVSGVDATYRWDKAQDFTQYTGPGSMFGLRAVSANGGASWGSNFGIAPQMEIVVDESVGGGDVALPGVAFLVMPGLMLLGWRQRRSR